MPNYKCLFSYYGGKSKIAHKYPSPKHQTIIEPFGGGGSYSLRYADRSVIINEINPRIVAIWHLLLSPEAADIIKALPDEVQQGTNVDDISNMVAPDHVGLRELLRAEANHGTAGCSGNHRIVTKLGATGWRVKPRLLHWLPKIAHWQLSTVDYREVPNVEATWFVDPPYNNPAGSRYLHGAAGIDYAELAEWCKSRQGQTIVCEGEGATWLPFKKVAERQGVRSRYQVSKSAEYVYLLDQNSPSLKSG